VPPHHRGGGFGSVSSTRDTQVIGAPSNNTSSAQTIEQSVAFYNSNAFQLGFTATEMRTSHASCARSTPSSTSRSEQIGSSGPQHGQRSRNVARVDRMQRRMAQMTLFELDDAVTGPLRGQPEPRAGGPRCNRARSDRDRRRHHGHEPDSFNTRMVNLANAFNDLDLADGEISANITFNIGNGTRIGLRRPLDGWAAANAPCFDPALRTAAP